MKILNTFFLGVIACVVFPPAIVILAVVALLATPFIFLYVMWRCLFVIVKLIAASRDKRVQIYVRHELVSQRPLTDLEFLEEQRRLRSQLPN